MNGTLILPKLFSDGCVLQQGACSRVWGWCSPGTIVQISIAGQTKETEPNPEGLFETEFSGLPAGGPYEMTVHTSGDEMVTVTDVYVGEVYVCAGQSNMELPMQRVRVRYPEEYKTGAPLVHEYKVTETYDFHAPLRDHEQASWRACTPENLDPVSAFSYFFGKRMQEEKQVPVGILNLSLGGTPVEAWTSLQGLTGYPDLLEQRERCADDHYCRELTAEKDREQQSWLEEILRQEQSVPAGQYGSGTLQLPGIFKEQGLENFCGSLILRRTFEVPEGWETREALLRLGTLTDSDRTLINGTAVGETGYCYPPRRYPVPAGVLKKGINEIEIHLICRNGGGRMTPDKNCDLVWGEYLDQFEQKVPLSGEWSYEITAVTDPAPEQVFLNRTPSGLFNGMAAPCTNYTVKGVIWYQGESNDADPDRYEELLKNFITDWRNAWHQEHLPFIVCQLPNCDVDIATHDAWARIRDAQRRAAQLPDAALTVNLELGEANDLHPLNKKDAAERAVLAALGMIDHESVIWRNPEIRSIRCEGSEVILDIETGDGVPLTTRDGADPEEFELAGGDGVFHPAQAKLEGCQIRIGSESVRAPRMIRYAWKNAPCHGLICSAAGLDMSPGIWRIEE